MCTYMPPRGHTHSCRGDHRACSHRTRHARSCRTERTSVYFSHGHTQSCREETDGKLLNLFVACRLPTRTHKVAGGATELVCTAHDTHEVAGRSKHWFELFVSCTHPTRHASCREEPRWEIFIICRLEAPHTTRTSCRTEPK